MHIQMFENLSMKALENVRSAIMVTDATIPDNPIVYVNPAFETLTGYGPDDLFGKNCRFLQGADRDQTSRHKIREALIDNRPVRAVLRNYRKDGSLFYNELFIDPIFDATGKVTHFIGCQNADSYPNDPHLLMKANSLYERLTAREREVFELVVNGYSNKLIATQLNISARTAEKHRIKVLNKFEVAEITLLVRYAIALAIPFKLPQDGFHRPHD